MMERVNLLDLCNPKQWKTLATSELKVNGKYDVYGANGVIGKYDEYNHENSTVLITCRGATCGNVHLSKPFSYINGNAMSLDNLDESKCLKEYLYYYLKGTDLSNSISGSAQPQITIQGLKKINVNLYDIDTQNKIIKILSRIERLIACKKEEIDNMNLLIKSQFVEMFGNIKTNDKKWNVYSNLLNYCVFNPKKNEIAEVNKDTMVTFLPMQNVSVDGVINYSIEKKISEVWKGFTYFKENDVLFAKITPCMENGKGAVAKKLKNGIGFGTTEFHVIRPNKEINSVWLYHVLADKDFRKEAGENMTGSAGQKRVPITFLENYKLAIPPIELQNKFAQIVEQIDKQKFEFENSLKKLEELQASLMQEYFG